MFLKYNRIFFIVEFVIDHQQDIETVILKNDLPLSLSYKKKHYFHVNTASIC